VCLAACDLCVSLHQGDSFLFHTYILTMASFPQVGEFAHERHAIEAFSPVAASQNLNHAAIVKPKVVINHDISAFYSPKSPNSNASFGFSKNVGDSSFISDTAYKAGISHILQEENRNIKLQLQRCQQQLKNAEQRASTAESELKFLQASLSPGGANLCSEVSLLSQRLPSPRLDVSNSVSRSNCSRRPASRNGDDESNLRCENLLLVIDDLRSRLASTTQEFIRQSHPVAGDESDIWRFSTIREQLRWADNVAVDQRRKKEAALSSLREVAASCKASVQRTPRHLQIDSLNFVDSHHEQLPENAQKWNQQMLNTYDSVILKMSSLEKRNQVLELQCEELKKALLSPKIAPANFDDGAEAFQERIFSMLASHSESSDLPRKSGNLEKSVIKQGTARSLTGEFMHCDADSLGDKNRNCILMLSHLIRKNDFMSDILEKLTQNMSDQVGLVDGILAEFQNLVRCKSSDTQFYSIQRSFQFVHQELMRLDECFHLVTKRPSKECADHKNLWLI
jgi:hypothetical protein